MTRLLLAIAIIIAVPLVPLLYLAAMILLAFGFGGGHWWGFVGGIALLWLVSALVCAVGNI